MAQKFVVAMMMHETNTFSPLPTPIESFSRAGALAGPSAIKESEGKVGGPIKVVGFVRYALGEGIDRPDSDFGGEVAALVKSN